jgi:NAD(P)-dependent dehydrogenase (short-subunit alcohol dehydrogenase family)
MAAVLENGAMNPTCDFKGQVALVTGAAMGMGLATARAFAHSGAAVVLADRDGPLAEKEAAKIVEEGGIAIGVACDVTDEAQVAAAVDRAVAEFGRLDMAFNNAGIQVPPSDAADEPAESFHRVTAVNQFRVWACMKQQSIAGSGGRRRSRPPSCGCAGPGASFVIGVGLPVDGGFTAP